MYGCEMWNELSWNRRNFEFPFKKLGFPSSNKIDRKLSAAAEETYLLNTYYLRIHKNGRL
jgi:hypothetical protein